MSHLRAAGVAFVPVDRDELDTLLSRTAVTDGKMVESAELKALRENLQLCRMSPGLQLPKESTWFDSTTRVLFETIKAQWHEGVDSETSAARSAWLLQLLDLRGWAHRYVNEQNRGISEARFRAQILALMTFSIEAPAPLRRAYWEWLDSALVDGVREQQKDAYVALVQDAQRIIRMAVARQQGGETGAN